MPGGRRPPHPAPAGLSEDRGGDRRAERGCRGGGTERRPPRRRGSGWGDSTRRGSPRPTPSKPQPGSRARLSIGRPMSDHEQLLLVIVVIYLTDCVFWASRCAVVFRDSFLAGAFAVLHPSTYVGHDRGGIVWRNPLPPFGTTMICPDRPVSVTPEHAYAYTAASALFGGRPEHPERIVALDEVKSVTVNSKDVLVNGKLFARTDSGVFARHLAESLDRLARLPMAERAGAIEADIDASLDTTRDRGPARRVRPGHLDPAAGLHLRLLPAVPAAALGRLPRSIQRVLAAPAGGPRGRRGRDRRALSPRSTGRCIPTTGRAGGAAWR